jgi:hypothetical protein
MKMLSAVTRKVRVWVAAGLAVFYAACLLAPVASFAFGNPEPHCLTDDNHGMASIHVHDGGVAHTHSPDASQPGANTPDGNGQLKANGNGQLKANGNCCGLFCLAAVPAAGPDNLVPASQSYAAFPVAGDLLVGGDPARLYRPPALAI